MKKAAVCLVYLFLFAMAAMESASAEDIAVTLYGDDAYPPYSFYDDGSASGIYPEIIREAGKRMEGFSLEIQLLPWRRLLENAKRGDIFGIFPPYYRPEERKYLTDYSVPILDEMLAVFCNQDILAAPRPAWPDDYFGLHFGKNLSFETGGPAFDQAVKDGMIRLEEIPGTELNVRKLLEGRIDCYINDRIAVLWTIKRQDSKKYKYSDKIKEGAIISSEQGFVAYSGLYKAKFKDSFIKAFDQAILSLQADGTVDKIVRGYTQ